MARFGIGRFAALLVAGVLACASAQAATTKVAYLTGGTVYAEAGSLDGLAAGDTVQLVRGDSTLALAKVTYVASHRAAADTLWTRGPIAVGDVVRFTPHALPATASASASDSAATAARSNARAAMARRVPKWRGRVGARWLSVDAGGMGFRQPALDLRLNARGEGGGHLDVAFDMRNRRTVRTGFGNTRIEQLSRVYAASLVIRTRDAHHSLSLGRQTSASLSSVSLFDGVVLRTGNERHAFGVFSGTQPDPRDLGVSADVVESGLFAEFRSAVTSTHNYLASFGGITSQQSGQPNRDFLFALASWSAPKLSSSFTQEIDWNRGWKRAQGEPALSPTSTFGTVRVAPLAWLGVSTGFDNRRNVRLWRDHETPADQFDDAYRQGAWLGTDIDVKRRVRLTGETRGSGGADHSRSWSTAAEAYRLTPMNVALRARVSQFGGGNVTSRLWSGGIGIDPMPLSHVEYAGGVRGTRIAPATSFDRQTWQSINVDLTLGRRWYLNGGWEHDAGGSAGPSRTFTGGASWRF